MSVELQSPSEQEIQALFDRAIKAAESAKENGKLAVISAWQCGKLLNAEKERIDSEHGRGKWSLHRAERFGYISDDTARRWMELGKRVVSISEINESNMMRQGFLALDIYPQKEYPAHGSGDINVAQFIMTTHLNVVNKWRGWWNPIAKKPLKSDEKKRLREDFKPMYEWLKGIYEI